MDFEEICRRARINLKNAREAAGLYHDQLNEFTGRSTAAYWDAEQVDYEICNNLYLGDIKGLCAAVGISGRKLFGVDSPAPIITAEQIIEKVRQYLGTGSIPLDEFEEKVGYYIGAALENPPSILKDWNVDCLRNVCDEVGLNWIEFFE